LIKKFSIHSSVIKNYLQAKCGWGVMDGDEGWPMWRIFFWEVVSDWGVRLVFV